MKPVLPSVILVLAPLAALHAADVPSSAKPNIIFILADDYGIPGVGCYGGAYKTPNLDALAAGGVRFERCYSAPLCARRGRCACSAATPSAPACSTTAAARRRGRTRKSASPRRSSRPATPPRWPASGASSPTSKRPRRDGRGASTSSCAGTSPRANATGSPALNKNGQLVPVTDDELRAGHVSRIRRGLHPASPRRAVLRLLPDAADPRADPAHARQPAGRRGRSRAKARATARCTPTTSPTSTRPSASSSPRSTR